MKFNLIAYKPSTSHARCGRGCCGYDHYDSDFEIERDLSEEEVVRSVTAFRTRKLKENESGFEFTVLAAGPLPADEFEREEFETALQTRIDAMVAEGDRLAQVAIDEREAIEATRQEAAAKHAREAQEARDRALYESLATKFGKAP